MIVIGAGADHPRTPDRGIWVKGPYHGGKRALKGLIGSERRCRKGRVRL